MASTCASLDKRIPPLPQQVHAHICHTEIQRHTHTHKQASFKIAWGT